MKKASLLLAFLVTLAVVPAISLAEVTVINEPFEGGIRPKANGDGCPDRSVEVIPLEDGAGVTILFSKWGLAITKEDQKNNVYTKNMGCTITIPLHVPKGFRMTAMQASYDGYASLPARSAVWMNSRYSFLGFNVRPVSTRSAIVRGPAETDLHFQDDLAILSSITSPCGRNTNLSINSRMVLENNNPFEAASVTVDAFSLALQEQFAITYRWGSQRCF